MRLGPWSTSTRSMPGHIDSSTSAPSTVISWWPPPTSSSAPTPGSSTGSSICWPISTSTRSDPPDKLETGTQSFESIAGVTAAVDYLAGLGEGDNRRDRLEAGYRHIGAHEEGLGTRFIEGVSGLGRVTVHGVPAMGDGRVATFAISVDGMTADVVASRLAAQGIYIWSGHYYALNAVERLGALESGGLARIGYVHYNTVAEVDRALEALAAL